MDFYRIVSRVLKEKYMKLSPQAHLFISNTFIPKLRETTLNYKNVLVFDAIKAAKIGNYDEVQKTNLKGHISYDFTYKLDYVDPNQKNRSLTVWVVYTNLRTSAGAVFSRLDKSITIYIPCVSLVGNNKLLSKLESNFKNKSFDSNSLSELETEFKESLKDIDQTYLNHMLKSATFKQTVANIEHEFIHATDPASYQSKDDSEESLEKHSQKYLGDYYGTPELNAGKIPAEFNPFFWNIIRSFETPLNSRTRKFLIEFIKNPQPLIDGLKLYDTKTLEMRRIVMYIRDFFKQTDKDYINFMKILRQPHYRKLLIRVFQDSYLKKKFLQKLYTFVEQN